MSATEELVRAKGLVTGYGAPLLPPVDFAVTAGEVLAVVGANGTGKSTLLRTVVGLLPPIAGELRILGRDLDARSVQFRAAVAVDLGDDAFFPALTVREHLLLTCYGHGVEEPEEVVDHLEEEFGLVDRADALPAALSSGQRRRLLLAAALARPRSLLVLDEPEQRLDAGMRRSLAGRLVEERDGGGAVLLASHDASLVAAAATSALLVAEGGVSAVSPREAADAMGRW